MCAFVNSIGPDFASDILRHCILSFPPNLVGSCLSALRQILSGISSSPQNFVTEKSVVADLFLPPCVAAALGKYNFWVIVCLWEECLTLYSSGITELPTGVCLMSSKNVSFNFQSEVVQLTAHKEFSSLTGISESGSYLRIYMFIRKSCSRVETLIFH